MILASLVNTLNRLGRGRKRPHLSPQSRVIDARLVVAAAGAWSGVLVATLALVRVEPVEERHSLAAVWLCCGLLLLGVGAAFLVMGVRSAAVIGVAAALTGAGVAAGSWQVHASTGAPVASWASAGATATVEGRVSGEPVRRNPSARRAWQSDWVELPLATSRISARGEAFDVGVPMVLRVAVGVEVPAPGSRVRAVGRLSQSSKLDVAAYLTTSSRRPMTVLEPPGLLDAATHAMRTALRSAASSVPTDSGALVAGLATGDESLQTPELAADMKASGMSHLTAVSGGNVAIVLGVVLAAAAAFRLALVWRVVLALLALGYFVLLVGPQPSVLRAAVMGSVVVLALLAGGRRSGPSVLAAAVTLLVLTSPSLASSWAFGLSVFATAGLILLSPVVDSQLGRMRATRRWPPAVRRAVGLTLAAQLATLPLLVAMGSAVGWVSVPANVLAMPAVPLVTVAGLAAALVGPALPAVAGWLTHVAAVPAAWIAWVAHNCADLPGARLPWPTGLLGGLAAVAALSIGTIGVVVVRRLPSAIVPPHAGFVVLGLLVGLLVLWSVAPPGRRAWPPPGWFVIMCDVGQGDALLVRDSPDSAVLVDAGPDPEQLDGCIDDAQIATVSAVVLTHFHADHVDGLAGAFRGRDVGAVLVNPVREPADRAATVDALLRSIGHAPAEAIAAGDRRRVGELEWEALWPRRRIEAGSVPNNASIVLAMHVGQHEVLLTGDIEPEAQAAIAAALDRYQFDVVKVPHHGSRYTAPQFVDAAPARIALVSVGEDNDYGHPASETIARWRATGATVLRTDEDGDVAIVSIPGTAGVGIATRR